MPIRAYIYGLDVTKDLISFNNKLTAAKRVYDEQSSGVAYTNFSEASLKEKLKTLSGQFMSAKEDEQSLTKTIVKQVPKKYLLDQSFSAKNDQILTSIFGQLAGTTSADSATHRVNQNDSQLNISVKVANSMGGRAN